MNSQGETYARFIEDQLNAERSRQSSLNERGARLQQSVSVTVGLFVTALGVVLTSSQKLGALHLVLFTLTVVILTLGFLFGVLATRLVEYEVADAATLERMLNERWAKDNEVDSRNTTAWLNAKTIDRMRAGNNWKAMALHVGLILQGAGVVLGTVTFGVVASGVLFPPL